MNPGSGNESPMVPWTIMHCQNFPDLLEDQKFRTATDFTHISFSVLLFTGVVVFMSFCECVLISVPPCVIDIDVSCYSHS